MDANTAQAWINASNSIQNAASVVSTAQMNQKQRAFYLEMWQRQRDANLADWNMQNAYNSPSSIMQRYKDAGLNPNLIYGNNGSPSPAIKSAEGGTPPQQQPEFRDNPGVQNIMSAQLMDAQLQNARAQTANIEADTALKLKNAQNVDTRTESTQFDLDTKRILQSNSIGQAIQGYYNDIQKGDVLKQQSQSLWEGWHKTAYEIEFLHNEDYRRTIMTSANVAKAVEAVLLMRQQELYVEQQTENSTYQREILKDKQEQIRQAITNMNKDGQMKDLLIKFQQQKIDPGTEKAIDVVTAILTQLLPKRK